MKVSTQRKLGDSGKSFCYLLDGDKVLGIILTHNGLSTCEKQILLWELVGQHSGPLYTCVSQEPLTIENKLNCVTCGMAGYIREGKWEDAQK